VAVARTPFIESAVEPSVMSDNMLEKFRTDERGRGGLGLLGLLVVIGLVLLIFPEPATSGIGLFIIVLAIIMFML
jgi:hypothetical protein